MGCMPLSRDVTFDAYNWGLVESKQKFIGQVMTGKSPARSIEDVDATTGRWRWNRSISPGGSGYRRSDKWKNPGFP